MPPPPPPSISARPWCRTVANNPPVFQRLIGLVSQLPELAQKDVLNYAEWRYTQFQDEDAAESIKDLTTELERLFSLLTSSERRSTLEQAALERQFREAIGQISKGATWR